MIPPLRSPQISTPVPIPDVGIRKVCRITGEFGSMADIQRGVSSTGFSQRDMAGFYEAHS